MNSVYGGNWRGTIEQFTIEQFNVNKKSRGTFIVRLELKGDQPDGIVGHASYDLKGIKYLRNKHIVAHAELEIDSESNTSIVLREKDFQVQGRAVKSIMELTPLPNGKLNYKFTSDEGETGNGILNRVLPDDVIEIEL